MIELPCEAPPAHTQNVLRFYLPELDGLRFYAFLSVFICHSLPVRDAFYRGQHLPLPWLWGAFVRSGGAGVDLFFVLSAFLITSLLLKERQETGRISLWSFYVRRTLRIWPLYFFVVALGIVFAHTMVSLHWFYEQSLSWYYINGYLFFIGNWVYAVLGPAQSICAPLWTVSIEEQFYLIWAAVVKRLKRRDLMVAAIVTFAVSTLSQVVVVIVGGDKRYIEFGSASRFNSLALGILLALCAHRLPRLTRGMRLLLLSAGLIGWIVSSAWSTDEPGPGTMLIVVARLLASIASAGILYACLHSRSKLCTGAWIVQLGKISYGLYMLHFTGLVLAATLFHPIGRLGLLVSKVQGFLITLFLAFASYRWIESPFLRIKDQFTTILSRPL